MFFHVFSRDLKSAKLPNLGSTWPPTWAQHRLNMILTRHNIGPIGPKWAQHRLKMAEHGPNTAQHRANMCPTYPQHGPGFIGTLRLTLWCGRLSSRSDQNYVYIYISYIQYIYIYISYIHYIYIYHIFIVYIIYSVYIYISYIHYIYIHHIFIVYIIYSLYIYIYLISLYT